MTRVRAIPLRFWISTLFLTGLLGATLLSFVVEHHLIRTQAMEEAEEELRQMALQVAVPLRRALERGQDKELRPLIASLSFRPELAVIAVVDGGGRVIAANHYDWRGQPIEGLMPIPSSERHRDGPFHIHHMDHRLLAHLPLDFYTGDVSQDSQHRAAALWLSRDTGGIAAFALHHALVESGVFLGITLLPLLVVAFTLQRFLVRPVSTLAGYARALAAGNYDTVLEVEGGGELATLARDLKEMGQRVGTSVGRIRASERRLSITLDSIGDAVIVTDASGRITRMNPVAEDLTGWPLAEAKGQPIERVFHIVNAETGAPAENPVVRVAREGKVVGLANHTTLIARDGRQYQIADSAAPIRLDGQVLGIIMVFQDVTARYAVQQHLAETSARLRALTRALPDLVFLLGPKGEYLEVFGGDPSLLAGERDGLIGSRVDQVLTPPQADLVMETLSRTLDTGMPQSSEYRLDVIVGPRWFEAHTAPFDDGKHRGVVWLARDITARKETEAVLWRTQQEFQHLTEAAPVGIFRTDAAGDCVYVNSRWSKISGLSPDAAMGRGWTRTLHPADRERITGAWQEAIEAGQPFEGEYRLMTAAGEVTWVVGRSVPETDENKILKGHIGTITDVTETKRAQEAVQRLAKFDPLTGLPNRRTLEERLTQALARSRRTQHFGAILFIDLDHFKTINDSLGHLHGDHVLEAIADRLQQVVRTEDLAARFGGDEFVVLLEDLGQDLLRASTRAESVAEKLRRRCLEPLALEGQALHLGLSMGVVLYPDQEANPEELLKRADIAMYQAKETGRDRICFFSSELQSLAEERLRVQRELRHGIETGELRLHVQPRVDAEGRWTGGEVLVRWQHPDRGLLSPAAFIPIAEETNLIPALDRWVIGHSIAALAHELEHDLPPRFDGLSLNLSSSLMQAPGFSTLVKDWLHQNLVPGDRIELEITERLLVNDYTQATQVVEALRAEGVRFSIDDFGTGFSSLRYLQHLPLDRLKIDKSFVDRLPDHAGDTVLVETILDLAAHLRLGVVAEGVERPDQLAFLVERGCHQFQGYLFQAPLPWEEFFQGLRERTPPA